jgi:maltose O-acetyltransferase
MADMKTEKEKMLAGAFYDALDPQLCRERARCREVCRRLNDSRGHEADERRRILEELFGEPTDAWIEPPFYCDYGTNILLGRKVYFNFNCVILDVMAVEIGDNVFFGPGVQVYAATHPLNAAERRSGREFGKAVTIGSDVWIGGGAILCPGVTIGARTVIGAGSVVTRSMPSDVVAAGNPCRILRTVDQSAAP